jgi:hypothetical protein
MAKKKQTDNEIIEELVAAATTEETPVVEEVAAVIEEPVVVEEPKAAPAPKVEKKAETLAPGEYYQGKRIEKYVAKLGKKWVAIIDGRRVKVNRDEIVGVK